MGIKLQLIFLFLISYHLLLCTQIRMKQSFPICFDMEVKNRKSHNLILKNANKYDFFLRNEPFSGFFLLFSFFFFEKFKTKTKKENHTRTRAHTQNSWLFFTNSILTNMSLLRLEKSKTSFVWFLFSVSEEYTKLRYSILTLRHFHAWCTHT